ncbi:ORF86-like protein [Bufonid herpesvirus 1]|uniref:ORF86-like protein n=1 Tax=Bufonid herpesvirus 1 TaxID=2282206 RepID=UPI000EB77CA7|nr:ORF86-like protein [Bufonid herpesvirus 1]AXF48546.1 ORF86-like protein [Bufonid herpesvirus 1]
MGVTTQSDPSQVGRFIRCSENQKLYYVREDLAVEAVPGSDTILGKTAKHNVYYGAVETVCCVPQGIEETKHIFGTYYNKFTQRFTHFFEPVQETKNVINLNMCYMGPLIDDKKNKKYPPQSVEIVHGKQSVKGSNNKTPSPATLWFVRAQLPKEPNKYVCTKLERAEECTGANSEAVYKVDCNKVQWGQTTHVSEEHLIRKVNLYKGNCPAVDSLGVPCFYVDTDYTGQLQKYEKQTISFEPLKTFDAFSGCGGLGLGLEQAGLCVVQWAADNWNTALNTLSINRYGVKALHNDIRAVAAALQAGKNPPADWPVYGDVDCLVGGPPCQGFTNLNRFPDSEATVLKNALVGSFINLVAYYKPALVIMENVRQMVVRNSGETLTSVIQDLIKLGYDVMPNVLQAGHYGVPQTRRRAIIIAVTPSHLPLGPPNPLHSFANSNTINNLSVYREGQRFECGPKPPYLPAFRTVTIREAFAGLPVAIEGDKKPCRKRKQEDKTEEVLCKQRTATDLTTNLSWYAREVAKCCNATTSHVSKSFEWLTHKRISKVPIVPGADWRSLPNEDVSGKDGKHKAEALRYLDATLKTVCPCQDPNSAKELGGKKICLPQKHTFIPWCLPHKAAQRNQFAGKKICLPQKHTFIPWCLPHKAAQRNQFAGVYGRTDFNGFLSTVLTNPNPGNHQGRVLHPTEPRVLSARECARGQGFPDTYVFCGSLSDCYKQVGNAVPIPLAKAIGHTILATLIKTNFSKQYVVCPDNQTHSQQAITQT